MTSESTVAEGEACSPPGPAEMTSVAPGLVELGRFAARAAREASLGAAHRTGPLPALTPAQLSRRLDAALPDGVLPRFGGGHAALLKLAREHAEHAIDLTHPGAAAHLQPPPMDVSVVADFLASAFNASVDTWDSGPYAVDMERRVIRALTELAGFGATAGGVLTSGGSASNLQAMLVARDRIARVCPGADIRTAGMRGLAASPVVLCSELAHFSVARACAVLGLGESAVHTVPVDHEHRMCPEALGDALAGLGRELVPMAIVATAGTTSYGSIDPLVETAAVAEAYGVWLHVDAAYGGGALFSDRLRPLLGGLESADSVTVDLHKTGWQPAAASALLVRDSHAFSSTERRVSYLNPDDDCAAGYSALLDNSLQTTRRADAVKIAAAFLASGRQGLGQLMDTCHELAGHAAKAIDAHPRLELTATGDLTTVVFRYRTRRDTQADRVNAGLRRRLLRGGRALIGRTDVVGDGGGPSVRLKLTLLNPRAQPHDIDALLDAVTRAGEAEEAGEQAPHAEAGETQHDR